MFLKFNVEGKSVTIIDSQVHAYAKNTPDHPWDTVPNWPDHVTGAEMIEAMDLVGVDGAILVSAFSLYGYNASYAVEVRNAYPERFGIVKPVDPWDPAVGDVIAEWKATPGTVGIRIMMTSEWGMNSPKSGLDLILREATRHDFPVNILCWDNLDVGMELIDRHADARFVIDHLGILQPKTPPAPASPWVELPKVLELSRRQNVAIKISGACTLSKAGYPFPDIWDPLARIFDAWGIDRCLWGTDWTRAFAVVDYEEAVKCLRLTDRLTEDERATLMGGACSRAYNWAP